MALESGHRELLLNTLKELGEKDFEEFRFYTDLPLSVREKDRRAYIADELIKKHGENTLDQTIMLLEEIGNNNLAHNLRSERLKIKGADFSVHDDDQIARLKRELQDNLRPLYRFASEGNIERRQQQPLEDVYTQLDVTYGADVSPEGRHEVLQMETCDAAGKRSILPCDIFKSPDGNRRPIRTMLTVGFAGIGKTFLIQKFVSDWASGNTNQDVDFIFPFTFRELNMEKGESFTLAELIQTFAYGDSHMRERLNEIFIYLQTSGKQDFESSGIKILFILDGLDECNFKIDLKKVRKVDMDVRETYPLEVLLAYLIKGNLLPCARVWITTRPASAPDIHSDFIDSRTEVRGFTDSQRLEYFRKRFPNKEHVIEHIRKSRTIYIMCHIPIFCWLTAIVLQDHLDKRKEGELPTTLTDMYSALIGHHLENSEERNTAEYIPDMKALAKLAFDHTMNNCQIFYEKDLADSGFDYGQAAKHSGIFTEVFKEVPPLRRKKQKMFQFIHLTIQEYLAALYVMMSLFQDKKNILDDSVWKKIFMPFKQKTITEVHKSALQKASESEGNLDMFLRFLLGLSLPCNQELVGELLQAPQDCGQSKSNTVELIKERIKQNTPEKNVNLFYCLNELKDDSLLKQIQQELASRRLSWDQMSNEMWSALAFFLLTDDKTMKSFHLANYSGSPLGLEKLLLVVKASQTSDLRHCRLDKGSCHLLASVLSSPSNLRHLDLSSNHLSDEGVEILSKGLVSPHCNLEVLKLKNCKITSKGCVSLAEALKVTPSHLLELDLRWNNLSDEGVEILSKGLASPNCILKVLNLYKCGITSEGCVSLAEALKVTPSHLQELDLSYNVLWNEGVEMLSKGLASPHCILKVLKLVDCNITQQGCISLAEALKVTSSHLQELELSFNGLSEEGVEILSKGLASPHCILKVLKLLKCKITGEGCVSLAEALKLNHSHLEELDLKGNQIGKRGARVLLEIKEDPSYSLKTVWMTLDSERKEWKELLLQTLMELREDDFEEFKFFSDLPQRVREHADRVVIADELMKKHGKNALKQTVKILEKMGNLNLAEMLLNDMLEITGAVFSVHDDDQITRLKADLQDNLRSLYSFVPEGNTEPWKQQQPLAEVYTEVDITYGADVTPNDWHEVLQMETRAAAAAKESILSCDIFKSPDGKPRPIRTLLTVGFAGIGKTFLVQKFVCDWASGNANQDVHFIFPFTFRELNTDKGKSFTLAELIRRYVYESRHMSEETLNNIFAELQMSGKQDYESSGIKILFVLDGLDECNFKMDLKNQMKVDIDVKKPYPLEVLLGHLIKRNLLPCSRVWITTRPATARDIRADLIDSRTVVRGFSDSRRLEYFSKRFPYEERVIEHIQKSRTIFIMCHIPIFCWLTATVLQDHLDKGKGELPTTLTDLYSAFLGYLLENSKERNTTEHIPYVKALAKLAFDHTMNNCQVFYEKDLADSGFDYGQAAKHSGIFTEVFQEVPPLSRSKQKTFQFIHLTIQEYLAALYVMMSLFHNNKNVLNDSGLSLGNSYLTQTTITDVHKSALKKASESKGHLDLFLRFLIGLSLPCNQELLGELLKAPQGRGQTKSKTVKLIKERIKQNTPEKNINLFYCLKELKDDSLLKQFHKKNRLDDINWNDMPNDMWSALAFFLLTDNKTIKSFKLSLYAPSPMGLQKLLVVVKASQESILGDCHLDKGSCHLLASVLSSPSNLRHLDLSRNDLSDEGVEILSKGLASPNCILEFLDLFQCGLAKGSCHLLASVLSSPSNLKHLNLSWNHLSYEGVDILSKGLASPNCILESLYLRECGLDKGSCHLLASVLSSPSNLRHLDLSSNKLSDEGVEILSKGLASPNCILESLDLSYCDLEKGSCHPLASLLSSPSHLKHLELSSNILLDEGVEILSKGLVSPNCILYFLKLSGCSITQRGCISLAEALKVTPSHLQELDLSRNDLSGEGVEILSKGLASPHCILKVLNLEHCGITSKGCVSLAEALKVTPSHLQGLDLSFNRLLDEGVEILSKGLASPNWILKVLNLEHCWITSKGCVSLAEALKVTPSHLQELDLDSNNLSDEGVEILSKGLASPNCILKVLKLTCCGITNKGCVSLAEALKLNPSHLQQLNLWNNRIEEKGKRVLLDIKEDPSYSLKTVRCI
ncbi:uncharacterized protein LOC130920622 isoform X2 [Corythoichthys intestinalis]|uniref:uncharacterized protein LOC130920622 isoform X2 n=1 Tax=Corythoichthys intestinalis TaxID=161448 RepID=UPI0025A66713|nr:uncharacterized protein LOC130920622 isoform X2 [Corythoichthys intestinalis]